MMKVCLLLVMMCVAGLSSADDFDISQHLSTKSPYWTTSSSTTPVPDGCSALHIDLVARHGSRDPTSGDIKALTQLATLFKKYADYITNDSFAWMKNWTNPYTLINQGYLSYSGELEHYNLAQRLKANYYPLFSQDYFPNVYPISSTQVPRTGVSASSFAFGFLEGEGGLGPGKFEPIYVSTETESIDVNLRFFDVCQEYVTAMNNGTINDDEYNKYVTMYYPGIAQDVEKRIGVVGNWNITNDQVDTLFTACSFETSVELRTDRFCSLFTDDEVKIYEYAQDLDVYYTEGYGSGIGYQISAPLLQNIVQGMDTIVAAAAPVEQANLRFAHAETVIPLVSLLGLFEDSYPITADSTAEQIENRQYRSSTISPFAANIMVVLYKCETDYKVKVLHNEVEHQIPGCDSMYCPYTQFKTIYNDALNFNFTAACTPSAPPPTPTPTPTPSPPVTNSSDMLLCGFSSLVFGVLVSLALCKNY